MQDLVANVDIETVIATGESRTRIGLGQHRERENDEKQCQQQIREAIGFLD